MATLPHPPIESAPAVDDKPAAQARRHTFHQHEAVQRPSYACPRCYSTQVMAQPVDSPWEWIISRLGIRNMYCRQCSHRFIWL